MRSRVCQVEGLEARELLSALPKLQPSYEVITPSASAGPTNSGYTPSQLQQAYQFNQVSDNGSGETIAIVDAYNDPNIQSNLASFDSAYGLAAPPSFSVVSQTGSTTNLPTGNSSWGVEESLDVEWAHAMAPGANIILVEANSSSDSDLLTAVTYAASHAQVVSMSWGGNEFNGEASYDSEYFDAPNVAYVVASGDSGAPAEWPAASPNVLGVGGTTMDLNSNNTIASEVGWSGSTGGPSAYEKQPSYQTGVVTQTSTARATPDVAYDADPNTGFAVYDTYGYSGWMEIGGTSSGAPQWSAIIAIADQAPAAGGQSALSTANGQLQTVLYDHPTDLHDITSGTSTGNPKYSAGTGYDYVTGLGTPMVNLVVGSLSGTTTTAPDKLVISTQTTATAGSSFNLTVTADLPTGGVDTGFSGTVSFTSTDGQAVLPGSFTFNSSDKGTYTFSVTLKTAGTQGITVTDGSSSATADVSVSPAAASQLKLSGLASSEIAGSPGTFTVTAYDPYGNVATGYTGTVTFTSSDASAVLPASSKLTSGTQTFSVTFKTAGTQSLTVTGTSISGSTTQSGIQVSPAAPKGLTATAASSSESITLTWSASTGATGYQVDRSTSPTTGFSEIGTTAAGTTTYQDSSLSAGTTYYYIVYATGGGLTSAASNTASATTSGTPPTSPTGTDLLWSTSSVPSENVYVGPGSYDLGLKFESTTGGDVTGVLFYKQTWMNGPNVGYLWSSTGSVLASASFSSETSYGWQQVNFSSPVAITANTIYIVSFSTDNAEAGATTGYFNSSYSNGPLEALSSRSVGGNGVYGLSSAGFPEYTEEALNFWVQPAFSPSTTSGVKRSPVGSTSGGHFAALVTTAPTATPSGPIGVASSSQGTSAPIAQPPIFGFAPVIYRPAVNQGRTAVLWGSRPTSFLS